MSLNDKLDSVILKRSEGSVILGSVPEDDDEFIRPQRPKRDEEDLDMDITPMIDITFLLLIFFLVSSRPDQTTAIQLPKAQHGDAVVQRFNTVISVGEGEIGQAPVYSGDGKFKENQLSSDAATRTEEIAKYVESGIAVGKSDIVIKGDRGVACRDIDGVLKAISKVQNAKIFLGVLESHSN